MSRLALAVLLLPLAACGELPRPFQPEYKGETNPLLMPRDRAGVLVQPIQGLPNGAAFAETLAEKLRDEGIVAMTGRGNSGSLVLLGDATPNGSGWSVVLNLVDAHGQSLGALNWRLAAGEGPAATPALAKAVSGVLYPDGPVPVAAKPVLAIGEVTGVPGEGGRALARALEFNLKRTDVTLAESPDKATHVVAAVVTIAPPRGNPPNDVRNVDVRWVVRNAKREEVGEIRQTNDVPARQIDRNWSEIAYYVADAAVEGITALLARTPMPAR